MSWEKIASDAQKGMALQVLINDPGVWSSQVFLWLPYCVNSSLRLVYSLVTGEKAAVFPGIWASSFILDLCRVALVFSAKAPGPGSTDTVSESMSGAQPDLKRQGRKKVSRS